MSNGQTCIVIGATGAIGSEVARGLAKQGSNLVLVYQQAAGKAEKLAEERQVGARLECRARFGDHQHRSLPAFGDLRDLILRPYAAHDTVVIGPNDLLTVAYQRMKLYEISQLPVMDGDRIVGIVDESDILLHVYGDEARFRDPVSTAMVPWCSVTMRYAMASPRPVPPRPWRVVT